jgi:hypothetical protein
MHIIDDGTVTLIGNHLLASEARVTEVVIFTVTSLGYITLGPAIDLFVPKLRLVCLLHFNLFEYWE